MLSVTPKFNLPTSQTNQSENLRPTSLKLQSQPMADSVSFGRQTLDEPKILINGFDLLGQAFIKNAESPNIAISVDSFKLSEAKKLAEQINAKAKQMNTNLQAFKPTQFESWLGSIIDFAKYHTTASVVEHPKTEEYGEYAKTLDKLIAGSDEDEKRAFVQLRNGDAGKVKVKSWAFEDVDFRKNKEMDEFLVRKFGDPETRVLFEHGGKKYIIMPNYVASEGSSLAHRGIKIVEADKMPKPKTMAGFLK